MNKLVKLEDALVIASRCAKAIEVAGRVYVDFPFNKIDMADALIVLAKHTAGVTKEEHVRLNRQYSALRARYVRLARKHNEKVHEDNDEGGLTDE